MVWLARVSDLIIHTLQRKKLIGHLPANRLTASQSDFHALVQSEVAKELNLLQAKFEMVQEDLRDCTSHLFPHNHHPKLNDLKS